MACRIFVLVTTPRKVLAVALGEPASDDATFNQPAARNTTLDTARSRTAKNRRPKVRPFEADFGEEFELDTTDALCDAWLGVHVGGLGGVDVCGRGGGASDISEFVLHEVQS